MYIYRTQSSLLHSEIRSDLKFIVLVVSLVFWIRIILWIKYILCSYSVCMYLLHLFVICLIKIVKFKLLGCFSLYLCSLVTLARNSGTHVVLSNQ